MKKAIIILIMYAIFLGTIFFCFTFPELISPIEKTALRRAVNNGDELAIEYYEENYLARGIKLWED